MSNSAILKERYEILGLSGDERVTACDYQLRDLEIGLGLESIRNGDTVLDVGCGPGAALRAYASQRKITAHGIDYATNMVALAKKLTAEKTPHLDINYQEASVLELPFEDNTFDVITSHRCLMALLDWDLQKTALVEIKRVLKPGGQLILMEGTFEGLEKLNFYRTKFGLQKIASDGKDRLITLKFQEDELLKFTSSHFDLIRTQRFGMYYFITRIIQPLLMLPEAPSYDHKINEVAKQIAKLVPDFEGIGHLVGFCLRKKDY